MGLRGMAQGVQMVQPLNNAFGTKCFIQSFCGARTDLCWWFFFQSCFTPGVECERKIVNRTGFCFVLWMLYT